MTVAKNNLGFFYSLNREATYQLFIFVMLRYCIAFTMSIMCHIRTLDDLTAYGLVLPCLYGKYAVYQALEHQYHKM